MKFTAVGSEKETPWVLSCWEGHCTGISGAGCDEMQEQTGSERKGSVVNRHPHNLSGRTALTESQGDQMLVSNIFPLSVDLQAFPNWKGQTYFNN